MGFPWSFFFLLGFIFFLSVNLFIVTDLLCIDLKGRVLVAGSSCLVLMLGS